MEGEERQKTKGHENEEIKVIGIEKGIRVRSLSEPGIRSLLLRALKRSPVRQ